MFKSVSSRVNFPELDANILEYWKEKDIFHRTETERQDGPLFMLFEGPPTANGSPGIHHVLARVFKDVICRYRTMKGYRCVRKGGWDTHGLPVELQVEKELGLSSKREIDEYGIEKFNRKCQESVFRYVKEWETLTDRIGFWVDMEHPYVTLDNAYIETGWWILKQLWDKGLLYRDVKATPHCPRCVTSLSSHEVALGYQEDTADPSVFVKFPVNTWGDGTTPQAPTCLLAWTTTPWTLPGNTALAVAEGEEYSLIEVEEDGAPRQRLVLATRLLDKAVHHPYRRLGVVSRQQLLGARYEPLYDPFKEEHGLPAEAVRVFETGGALSALGRKPSELQRDEREGISRNSWQVHAAGFVSMEDGTGIVHIAPAFGEEDLSLGRAKHLAYVQPVNLQGAVIGTYSFAGRFVKEADPLIMADLEERGLLYHRDVYRHTYPFCWRCDTPLLYYAKSSWYIRTSKLKDELVQTNSTINWYPEHIREGRFGEWLRNNVDWAISRERYWGTPIPIWTCHSCGHSACIGSVAELQDWAITGHEDRVNGLDLHRPYVDQIVLLCRRCLGQMHRIPEVMDAWFDSGAMPYAQWHYPFENQSMVEDGRFPADYICEAVDQTRGWFYSLHALAILLMQQPSYRNVICLGLILDEKGRKMSKRLGNIVRPMSVLDASGADALRWYLFTATQPGEPRRFSTKLVNEVLRRFLLTLWNVYSFFANYAGIDRFEPRQISREWRPVTELDRWILSELNHLVVQVDGYLDAYNPTDAGRRMQEFVDQLSNWYVRRGRRRFWRSEGDADKMSAYATLYTCLETLTRLMAPLAPFVAEEMYQNLVMSSDPEAPDSVHLAAYPVADQSLIDRPLMEATRLAMKVSSMGRAARSKAGLKVRQPLASVLVRPRLPEERQYLRVVQSQVMDELNIKELRIADGDDRIFQEARRAAQSEADAIVKVDHFFVSLEGDYGVAVDSRVTDDLRKEGLARELSHRIQNLRKDAGFEITDRIITYYHGPAEIDEVMGLYSEYICQETLSEGLVAGLPEDGAGSEPQKVEGMDVLLSVKRV